VLCTSVVVRLKLTTVHPLTELTRLGCDLMNFFFVYDEYTDDMDRGSAQLARDMIMDAFRNPSAPRPQGESFLGEMARQCVSFGTFL